MSITTTQKIIKVGSSAAVTIPAKTLRSLGVTTGDELDVTFSVKPKEVDQGKLELVTLTQQLIKRHEVALKNLRQR